MGGKGSTGRRRGNSRRHRLVRRPDRAADSRLLHVMPGDDSHPGGLDVAIGSAVVGPSRSQCCDPTPSSDAGASILVCESLPSTCLEPFCSRFLIGSTGSSPPSNSSPAIRKTSCRHCAHAPKGIRSTCRAQVGDKRSRTRYIALATVDAARTVPSHAACTPFAQSPPQSSSWSAR
jgi:hypothetical protein